MRPLQAHCHLGLGTLYVKTGQREQARTALSTAIELYRDMDMTFWLPQAEAALAQVEGVVRAYGHVSMGVLIDAITLLIGPRWLTPDRRTAAPPTTICSVRSIITFGPQNRAKDFELFPHNPVHATAAAQMGQCFSIRRNDPSACACTSAMYPSSVRMAASASTRCCRVS